MNNSRLNFVIATGFILTIIGGFMNTQTIELGGFVSAFGSGVLATGVVQFVYMLIQKRKTKQTTQSH